MAVHEMKSREARLMMGEMEKGANGGVARDGWTAARFEPKWISCRNERNFQVMMDILEKGAGEGRFGLVYGPAGRGKSRTTLRYAAHNRCVHLLVRSTWRGSELGILQALCYELGMAKPPARKESCFIEITDRLIADPRPIFLDEMEKIPRHLDLVREISEITSVPFILIGEMELETVIKRNRRCWSRTFQAIHFEPVAVPEIINYGRDTAGLELSQDAATLINKSAGGEDWRVVKRVLFDLIEIANMNKTRAVTRDMAKTAVKMGLVGR